MPEATITFSLPDEEQDFALALKGALYHEALQALAQAFRDKAKHADAETTWETAKDLFWDTLADEGVDLQ